ncbi:hypothetical protein K1T71_011532 [Dendrolimus kikuchii]|uniref:Uncharacterized protein n=1 Tax=Dendrolimus kikuchii TaxID=765133 RepID=A0ACC1CP40_9NEOP|nr:hypothetical protein K1T71_011532 [Dendrolimus kikuchii]
MVLRKPKDFSMLRPELLLTVLMQLSYLVSSDKQQLQLSDSYLPVAMQVIAHLTDQMAFEIKDDVTPRPTTQKVTRPPQDKTTPYHKPGLYQPFSPPKPSDRYRFQQKFVLLPMEQNAQYTVIAPQETRTESLLSIHNEQVHPIIEPRPQSDPLLPPVFDVKISSRSDGFVVQDISEENLQYLSDDVREMIKLANDPNDGRVVDVWEEMRSGPHPVAKAKLSSSNLRLLLLYDLLSREAKRQRLSDYNGFSPTVMKVLADSANGGARAQLRLALSKMVERNDCGHEYANNRAKEMVKELDQDSSVLSSELRYLQPLVYKV